MRISLSRMARGAIVIARPIVKLFHFGGQYYCPVCAGSVRNFLPHGDPARPFARCPICGSLERHRLDWIFFANHTDLFDGKGRRILHVAPEKFLSRLFRGVKNLDYLSADLKSPRAMVKMDITDIQYPDNSFSVIYCSHVLEHVPDDRKALAEFYRVLKPGGWAVLQVPISSKTTFEDLSITDPDQRKIHFGQWDHVRRCGPDYADRMWAAGFEVQVLRASDIVSEYDCKRMGFGPDRIIFFCRKTESTDASSSVH